MLYLTAKFGPELKKVNKWYFSHKLPKLKIKVICTFQVCVQIVLKRKKEKSSKLEYILTLMVVCIGQKMAKFDSWNSSYKRGALFKILGKKWPS